MKTRRGFWCSASTLTVSAVSLGAAIITAPACSEAFSCSDRRDCEPGGGVGAAGKTNSPSFGGAPDGGGGTAATAGIDAGGTGAGTSPNAGEAGSGGAVGDAHGSSGHSGRANSAAGGDSNTMGGDASIIVGTNSGGTLSTGGSANGGGTLSSGGAANGGGALSSGGAANGGMPNLGNGGANTNPCTPPASGPAQCTAQCPCAIGAGQCTAASGCNAGLVCGANTGAKFGFSGNTCVPKHCDNDVVDADETSVDCGGECGCSAEFTRLGFLSTTNQESVAADVSADGSVVVGTSQDLLTAARRPFRWSKSAGLQRVAVDLAVTGRDAGAEAVSGDGSILAGNLASYQGGPEEPFSSSPSGTGLKLAAGQWAHLQGLSADGRVAVGETHSSAASAWGTGAPSVGNLGPGASSALDASGDGSVVVGFATDSTGSKRPTVWRISATARFLDAPTGSAPGRALSISGDGRFIAGSVDANVSAAIVSRALVWSVSGTDTYSAQRIEDLEGGQDSNEASDLSTGSSVVIGWGTTATGKEPFIWDRVNGTRRLVDELRNRGFEWPSTASLGEAVAISADGTTIVGTYQNPEARTEAWRIVLH